MPANLNALIRYKTINSCLSGGRRRWSIDELRERCTEALAENRGRYGTVSERTIRDDIRIMRSDILGFNAPIKQEAGFYFYSDPEYSILSLRITDEGLAEQILGLLIKMRGKVNHPEMEIIMAKLCRLIGREYEPEITIRKHEPEKAVRKQKSEITVRKQVIKEEIQTDELLSFDQAYRPCIEPSMFKLRAGKKAFFPPVIQPTELIWGEIMAAVMA